MEETCRKHVSDEYARDTTYRLKHLPVYPRAPHPWALGVQLHLAKGAKIRKEGNLNCHEVYNVPGDALRLYDWNKSATTYRLDDESFNLVHQEVFQHLEDQSLPRIGGKIAPMLSDPPQTAPAKLQVPSQSTAATQPPIGAVSPTLPVNFAGTTPKPAEGPSRPQSQSKTEENQPDQEHETEAKSRIFALTPADEDQSITRHLYVK